MRIRRRGVASDFRGLGSETLFLAVLRHDAAAEILPRARERRGRDLLCADLEKKVAANHEKDRDRPRSSVKSQNPWALS
jgi:hypothetical protein